MTKNVYTVKQVNAYIKNMFTQDFMLNRIYVKGEVSNCKYHTSGHIYFSLKDESGTIACVMFAGQRSGLAFRMSEGQQVIVFGSVSDYERSGSYQLYARQIRLDGETQLCQRFQELKRRLEGRGTETPEVIASRMKRAREEAEYMDRYDYLIINDDLNECVEEMHQIIQGEHRRSYRNNAFMEHMKEDLKGE